MLFKGHQVNKKNQLLVSLGLTLSFNANAVERIIIKYKPTETQEYNLKTGSITSVALNKELQKPLSKAQISTLSEITSYNMVEVNTIANGAHVLAIKGASSENLSQIISDLNADPHIQYAEIDRIMKPNDFRINDKQWDLRGVIESSTSQLGTTHGDNLYAIFELGLSQKPGQDVVVAVIDTGYTPHPNFISQLIDFGNNKYGYSFISDCRMSGECSPSTSSNTNIKYKINALDLGNYISASDISSSRGFFDDCSISSSSWHGTHVMGSIIAQGYNSENDDGILGGAFGAKVLPIRAVGKCGGYVSDITNAMLWAAGTANVSDNNGGVLPINPNPADIINLSLGSSGACSHLEQDVINTITDNGTNGKIIVVSAGNSSDDVQNYTPANCNNVINVAAKGSENKLAYYSNWGNVDIVASGGDGRILSGHMYSTSWGGVSSFDPNMGHSYTYMQGTSMAAPNVSSAIASMISVLKQSNQVWNSSSIKSILQHTAVNLDQPCYTSGKCVVTKSALDGVAAVSYVMTNFNGSLDILTDISKLYIGENITVRLKNNNSNDIEYGIMNISLSNKNFSLDNNSITILKNDCTTIPTHAECSIILQVNGEFNGKVSFNNTNGITLVDTYVNVENTTQLPLLGMNTASSGSGGGGGCTMIENGDDYSLIMLILLTSVYGIRRKYFTKSVK